MSGQEQALAEKRPRGRPRIGQPTDPLVRGLKIYLPVVVLEQVDSYLAAERKANPQPRVLSRSEGIRDLVQKALDAYRAGLGHLFEPMPRELLENSHMLALRLLKSIFDGVEEFKNDSASRLRVVAIQDLLWNGLRIGHVPTKSAGPRLSAAAGKAKG